MSNQNFSEKFAIFMQRREEATLFESVLSG